MSYLVREMTQEDCSILKSILTTDFDDFWTPSLLQAEFDHPNTFICIATDETEIVGFGSILKILEEVHLTNIVTKKTKRNLGIGHQILDTLIQKAKQWQADSMTLEVNEKNKAAFTLYQSFGFQEIGRRKKYYDHTDDALIMTRYFNQ